MVCFTKQEASADLTSFNSACPKPFLSKTVGILGGLGPETTWKFCASLIQKFLQKNAFRPRLLVFNVPMPLELETQTIQNNEGSEDELLALLVEGLKRLEKGGADFIVVPCNTVHVFIRQMRKSVSIPVLSIVEETAKFLAQQGVSSVRIISTTRSRKQQLFTKEFCSKGIKTSAVSERKQKQIDGIIQNILVDQTTKQDKHSLLRIISSAHTPVLLACTDLQNCVKPDHKDIFDTMEILVDAALRELMQKQ